MSDNTIVLIGPMGAGKTTVGELLSQRLNRQWIQIDEIRYDYYREIGYDEDIAREKHRQGMAALLAYWKPFEVHAVERVLADYENAVIDFGAGHSVYEDAALLERAKRALAPFPNVVLLLPAPDFNESLVVLTERLAQNPEIPPDVYPINEHFLRHPSNGELAKFTVYTKGKTPEQTCDEILALIVES